MKLFKIILLCVLAATLGESFHNGDGKAHFREEIKDKESEVISDSTQVEVIRASRQNENFSLDDKPKFAKQTKEDSSEKPEGQTTIIEEITTSEQPIEEKTESSIQSSPMSSKPTTTSTPAPSTSTTEKPLQELYCFCDIHRNTCDMNCCCDTDCTDTDRKFFAHCDDKIGVHDDRSSPRRQRSCYKSFVTFKHYEAEGGIQSDNGMLCILRDNNKADNILPTPKINELQGRIEAGEIRTRPKYFIDSGRTMIYKQEPYKYGSPILGMKESDLDKEMINERVFAYGLPAPFLSTPCTKIREPVKFLENFYTNCKIPLSNLSRDCEATNIFNANYFLDEIRILKNPEGNQSIPITPRKFCIADLCTDMDQVKRLNFSSPVYNRGKQLCENVLTGFSLTIYYGLDGISDIIANAQLQHLGASTKYLVQEYRAKFMWNTTNESNETNSTQKVNDDLPRSGNPGYIVGKNVILGEKVPGREIVKNEKQQDSASTTEIPDGESEIKEMSLVWNGPSRWMSIHNPGKCLKDPVNSERRPVFFDYSHLTVCSMNLTEFKYCENLQLQIVKILLGTEDPLNFDKRKWLVAAFGNADPDQPSEWVPFTFKNFPITAFSKGNSKSLLSRGCDIIIPSLNITISYAFVGSVDFPQAKITGVSYELGEYVSISKERASKAFTITTTVTFRDTTAPPVMSVAKWPIISVRLPKDFFYPFST